MINITIKPETWEMMIDGHAGSDEKGKDIVCAAVSILFYTLGENLWQSASMLWEEPIVRQEDGNGYIVCHPKEEYEGNVACMYRTIMMGMKMMAEHYPEYVSLKVEG